jgi:hypothetical protein
LSFHFLYPGGDEFVGECVSSIGANRNFAVDPFVVDHDAGAPEQLEQARLAAVKALAPKLDSHLQASHCKICPDSSAAKALCS